MKIKNNNKSISIRIMSDIKSLNEEIINAHQKHYETSPTGLIIPTESPNGNLIYHLYSDGTITYQKGGWAYGQRNVFESHCALHNYKILCLEFPKTAADETTYVILTKDECINFRNRMAELIK